MAFRKGTDLIREQAERKGGGKFTRNIYWKNGDVKTVAFLTPAEEIPKVMLHQFVQVPDDKFEKGYRNELFLCRKDPSMIAESSGVCPLCEDIGHEPTERFVALAVELDPVKDGKETSGFTTKTVTVKRDDGTEAEYVQWGLVIQGAKNFFSYLAAYDKSKGDITKLAFEIGRDGDGIGTKYHFIPERGVDLPDFTDLLEEIPTLEDLLTAAGSDEKYTMLSSVEPGSQPTYGNSNSSSDRDTVFSKIQEAVAPR